jgi:hypothetical protein
MPQPPCDATSTYQGIFIIHILDIVKLKPNAHTTSAWNIAVRRFDVQLVPQVHTNAIHPNNPTDGTSPDATLTHN